MNTAIDTYERLSLGHSILESNNIVDAVPVIMGNYIGPNHEMPLPWPSGDWYLCQTFVPAVSTGEKVVCNTLIPGLKDYYKEIGALPKGSEVIEVDPRTNILSDNPELGFPSTDPLAMLGRVAVFGEFEKKHILCSTFDSKEVSAQASSIGLDTLDRTDSFLSNHKARLRRDALDYDIAMLPGTILEEWCDLAGAVNSKWNSKQGTWLKFPTGSGGDLVQKITGIATEDAIKDARDELRKYVEIAFDAGSFDTKFSDFWPIDQLCPTDFPLVLEADASISGEAPINGSSQFITDWQGNTRIIGHFTQITTNSGEYLGNEPYSDIDDSLRLAAEKQVANVARYNAEKHNYFGIAAIDWFATRDYNGEISVLVGELNSRPTANTPPVIIAQKFGAAHFVNINAYTQQPIDSVENYFDVIGKDLAFGDPRTNGLVLPQAFRSVVNQQGVLSSPNFKMVVLGQNSSHCRDIMGKLSIKGIQFSPE